MGLPDANLTDLVAELRLRLRHFVEDPTIGPAGARAPGALAPAERAALACRVLAEALRGQEGVPAADTASALTDLGELLVRLPRDSGDELPSAAIAELVADLEDLACAWDRGSAVDLVPLWQRVRAAGDRLWEPTEIPTTPADANDSGDIWLLATGALRESLLCERLEQAGVTVVCFDSAVAVEQRLEQVRPRAVICDDAAPRRHYHRLQQTWPAQGPPLVRIAGRAIARPASRDAWCPPYRFTDLQALLDA